ncbi:uncharacterized protein BDR25DRAFT_258749 [Lindgomyces ingoldianus]|uniref:Uncharacterized protein n=1 Tax=Lindgomyces ingoldianus TaxID=673940 RepID=A0ACB6QZJ4_9PLEO|nr:uncharacterized protein BDR25DRAFT_258749 [Lindgomyces ingoldianus]KAF2472409.1 hypothetical protein BDR25DRAFT_258749 [Lindgomyces ingoldianus]
MGICSSCLGLRRRPSDSLRSDSSHLLGDPYQPHYGSINGPGSHGGPQLDPEEIRRQRDALERICAQTSGKLIHVSQATYTEDGSKMASEYPRLFNERFPPSKAQSSRPSSADASADEDEATWLEHVIGNTAETEGSWERVEPIESGALTIHFGEAPGSDRRQVR